MDWNTDKLREFLHNVNNEEDEILLEREFEEIQKEYHEDVCRAFDAYIDSKDAFISMPTNINLSVFTRKTIDFVMIKRGLVL